MRRPVTLRIDRLVLDGVPPGDRRAVVRALQAALQSRLAGLDPGASRRVDRLAAGPIADTSSAAGLGRAAAGAVAQALGRRGR